MEIVKSTFDTQTPEGMLQVFNATNGASIPLRNAIGEVLELKDILVAVIELEEELEEYDDEELGEVEEEQINQAPGKLGV